MEQRCMEWKERPDQYTLCKKCQKNRDSVTGTLFTRYVIEPDGFTFMEYQIRCPHCGTKTRIHRTERLTRIEWDGMNDPDDILSYRNKGKGPKA